MTRQCWVGTVSKEHVMRGQVGGFAQVCHGKQAPLKRMQENDLLIYYSPTKIMGDKVPYQNFTAIGIILPKPPYQYKMSEDFIPFRRDVNYLKTQDAPIRPLLSGLSFIQDKTKWGAAFRFGILKIPQQDFHIIAKAMGLSDGSIHELFV